MKIIHFADTHIGFSTYSATAENGINLREQDAQDAFTQVIDYCIQTSPDLILHAGDLFHSVSPSNQSISFVMEQLYRIEKAEIPMVICGGNHEAPKRTETKHVFEIYKHFKHIEFVHQSTQHFHFPRLSLNLCVVPFLVFQNDLEDPYSNFSIEKDINTIEKDNINILLTHGSSRFIKIYQQETVGEQYIENSILENGLFDYVALGHYHKPSILSNRAAYSGSLIPLTFGEIEYNTGFIELEFDEDYTMRHTFKEINTRKLVIKTIDCTDLNTADLTAQIINTLNLVSDKSIILKLQITGMLPESHKLLNHTDISRVAKQFSHCVILYDYNDTENVDSMVDTTIGSLKQEWSLFLSNNIEDQDIKKDLNDKVNKYWD